MDRIDVKTPNGAYPILVDESLIQRFGELIRSHGGDYTSIVVVTNPTVAKLWQDPVLSSLRTAGFSAVKVDVPDGEQYKSLGTVNQIYEAFLAAGLDTRGLVVALGGGVVGDMAGFAAATFMRGVALVQIPTTLLSMVDSSVGGKTGVDLKEGKNLVGAYKQPEMVLIDPVFLSTLPDQELTVGSAEVLKHGIIGDPHLFEQLETGLPDRPGGLIGDAVRVKVNVVTRDPFEKGERATLNLGHTFGHALELLSNYEMPHGEAVAFGLVAAARMSAHMGKCAPELVDRVKQAVQAIGLPTRVVGYSASEVKGAMGADKKRIGGRLRFVIPLHIGSVEIVDAYEDTSLDAGLDEILGD